MSAMRALASASILLGMGGFACNGSIHAAPDAGSSGGDGPAMNVPLTGVHAFTVSSRVTSDPSNQTTPFGPTGEWTQSFKLVLDTNAGLAILGATREADATPYQSNDGRTFDISGTFFVAVPDAAGSTDTCGTLSVEYGPMTVQVASDGHLTGAGTAGVCAPAGDTSYCSNATLALTGEPDVDPPVLTADEANSPVDPFISVSLSASEPLPLGTRPTMTSASGDRVVFAPPPPGGSPELDMFVAYFPPPDVLLRHADTYTVLPDGVVNLVGTAAANAEQFQTSAAPPLAPQDGFESVTDASLGGATVVSGLDPRVIAGAKSLYVPPQPASARPASSKLALRLVVPPGATTIRFSYRKVDIEGEDGSLHFGWASVGQPITTMDVPLGGTPVIAELPDQSVISLGDVTLAELPLGAGTGAEVELALVDPGSGCPPHATTPLSNHVVGIVIDDLRVE
jgi:hypothetical protein